MLFLETVPLHRPVLAQYSIQFLDQLTTISAAATLIVYILYTLDEHTRTLTGSSLMPLTIPFVIYGLFRYLLIVGNLDRGGDPSRSSSRQTSSRHVVGMGRKHYPHYLFCPPLLMKHDPLQIQLFRSKRVLVLGDIMIDHYIYGDSNRISPEAPVPIVNRKSESYHLGGAANVAHAITSSWCRGSPVWSGW